MIKNKNIIFIFLLLIFLNSPVLAATEAQLAWSKSLSSTIYSVDTDETGSKVFAGLNNGSVVSFDSAGSLRWITPLNASIKKIKTNGDGSRLIVMNNINQSWYLNGTDGSIIKSHIMNSTRNISDVDISTNFYAIAGSSWISIYDSQGRAYASNWTFSAQNWSLMSLDPNTGWVLASNGANKTWKWNISPVTYAWGYTEYPHDLTITGDELSNATWTGRANITLSPSSGKTLINFTSNSSYTDRVFFPFLFNPKLTFGTNYTPIDFKSESEIVSNPTLTRILLHFDGTNGSQVFTDDAAPTSQLWNGSSSSPYINTTTPKGGSGALYFPQDYTKYVMTSASPNLNVTGNFTIDFWYRRPSNTTESYPMFFRFGNGMTTTGYSWSGMFYRYQPPEAAKFALFIDGGYVGTTYCNGAYPLSNETWHHFALSRNMTVVPNFRVFINGSFCDFATMNQTMSPYAGNPAYQGFWVGSNSTSTNGAVGGFDEFEFVNYTKYWENFTPPAVATGGSIGSGNTSLYFENPGVSTVSLYVNGSSLSNSSYNTSTHTKITPTISFSNVTEYPQKSLINDTFLTLGNVSSSIQAMDVPELGGWVGISTSEPKIYHQQVNTVGFGTQYSGTANSGTARDIVLADSGSYSAEARDLIFDIYQLDGTRKGTYSTGGTVRSVDFAVKNGLWAISGGDDGKTYIFSKDSTSSWYVYFQGDSESSILSTAMSWRGEYAAAGRNDGTLDYYNLMVDSAGTSFITDVFVEKTGIAYSGQNISVDSSMDGITYNGLYTGITDSSGKYSFSAYDGMYYRITVNSGEASTIYHGSQNYKTISIIVPSSAMVVPYTYSTKYNESSRLMTFSYVDQNAIQFMNLTWYNGTSIAKMANYTGVLTVTDTLIDNQTGNKYGNYKLNIHWKRTDGKEYHESISIKSKNAAKITGTPPQWQIFLAAISALMLAFYFLTQSKKYSAFVGLVGVVFWWFVTSYLGFLSEFTDNSVYDTAKYCMALIVIVAMFKWKRSSDD